jgi:hypothetical protein
MPILMQRISLRVFRRRGNEAFFPEGDERG